MTVHSAPFPSHDCSEGGSPYLETRQDFERLLSACGDAFVARHAPEMTLKRNARGQLNRWEFPLGTPIGKLRPRVRQLWSRMPDNAKQLFLLSQYTTAMAYLQECAEAYENAGFDVPEPIENLDELLSDTEWALAPIMGELLGYPPEDIERMRTFVPNSAAEATHSLHQFFESGRSLLLKPETTNEPGSTDSGPADERSSSGPRGD